MSDRASYTETEGHITVYFGGGVRSMFAELEGIIRDYVPANDAQGHHRRDRAQVVLDKLLMFAADDAEQMIRQGRPSQPVKPEPLQLPLHWNIAPREG